MVHINRLLRLAVVCAVGLGCLLATDAAAQSETMPLGEAMPTLDDPLQRVTDGESVRLDDLHGENGTVLIFWSNECPWVERYEDRLHDLVRTYRDRGFQFTFVNSNNPSAFPRESLEDSRERARSRSYQATYVRDRGGRLADAVGATRTPQVFLFDETEALVYTGAIDDSPADAEAVRTRYLHDALEAIHEGRDIETNQTRAFGCTIKR